LFCTDPQGPAVVGAVGNVVGGGWVAFAADAKQMQIVKYT